MRRPLCVVAAAFLPLILAGANPALSHVIVAASPSERPMPAYPQNAVATKGEVRLTFDLDANGHVQNLRILGSTPAALFDKAATDTVLRWTYHPRTIDGQPAPQAGNAVILHFEPHEAQLLVLVKPEPEYPRDAYLARQEAAVSVKFDVDANGNTGNIRLTVSLPPTVFDQAAIEAVKSWRFAPDAALLPAHDIQSTIPFSIRDANLHRVPERPLRPVFPLAAEQAGVIGDCTVDYTIEENGSVSGAVIKMCNPGGYFEKASLDVANAAHYRIEADPSLNHRQHHSLHLKYRFSGVPESDVHYLKPGQWVKLQYTLTRDGHARQINVLAVSNPSISPKRAVAQLHDMTLQPVIENGAAVEKQGLVFVISGE